MADTAATWRAYQNAFGEIVHHADGVERRAVAWPDWAPTARIESGAYRDVVWKAVECHQSQISGYSRLKELTPEDQAALWNAQTYYRVFSLVNGGRERETDLFAGLR